MGLKNRCTFTNTTITRKQGEVYFNEYMKSSMLNVYDEVK